MDIVHGEGFDLDVSEDDITRAYRERCQGWFNFSEHCPIAQAIQRLPGVKDVTVFDRGVRVRTVRPAETEGYSVSEQSHWRLDNVGLSLLRRFDRNARRVGSATVTLVPYRRGIKSRTVRATFQTVVP